MLGLHVVGVESSRGLTMKLSNAFLSSASSSPLDRRAYVRVHALHTVGHTRFKWRITILEEAFMHDHVLGLGILILLAI